MVIKCVAQEGFAILSSTVWRNFGLIARLERDAEYDEAQMNLLEDIDHIRRQMRLIAAQRSEALRMRLFLDRAKTRLPRPLINL